MIRNEDWLNFIQKFFQVDPLWIKHVVKNWNHRLSEPGCECQLYEDADGITQQLQCPEYRELVIHTRLEDTDSWQVFNDNSEIY